MDTAQGATFTNEQINALAKAFERRVPTTGGRSIPEFDYLGFARALLAAAPTPVADSGATLSEAAIQSMVQTRGRLDGSLWKFDALGISLLINDIALALLAAAKPVRSLRQLREELSKEFPEVQAGYDEAKPKK